MSIIKSYEKLKKAILTGINNYKQNPKKKFGEHRGNLGQQRAENTINYINKLTSENEKDGLLMVMFAIFEPYEKELFGWVPGRSSTLAFYIANEMISIKEGSICSEVFDNINENLISSAPVIRSGIYPENNEEVLYFLHKTKAIRHLLKNLEISFEKKENILQNSRIFKPIIEKNKSFNFDNFSTLFASSMNLKNNINKKEESDSSDEISLSQ